MKQKGQSMLLGQIESTESRDNGSLLELIESIVNAMLAADDKSNNIYGKLISEVESALLNAALKHTKGNQSRAAILLGLSRGTLRKKMMGYGLGSA